MNNRSGIFYPLKYNLANWGIFYLLKYNLANWSKIDFNFNLFLYLLSNVWWEPTKIGLNFRRKKVIDKSCCPKLKLLSNIRFRIFNSVRQFFYTYLKTTLKTTRHICNGFSEPTQKAGLYYKNNVKTQSPHCQGQT